MFLALLGNAYKVNITAFQCDEKRCWICGLSDNSNSYSTTLHFAWKSSPHIDPVVKFAGPMEDDDEITMNEIIPWRNLADARKSKARNYWKRRQQFSQIKRNKVKKKEVKQESLQDEFVSYNGKLLP